MKTKGGLKSGYPGLAHMANYIVDYIPECDIFVEPFAGLGRISRLVKAKQKVLNDMSDLLKLDCEGAEFEILLNLDNESYSKIQKIALEYHLYENTNRLGLLNKILTQNNYNIKIIPESEKIGHLYAGRTA